MAVELLSDRNRALGAAGTFLANVLLLAALLSLSSTAPPVQSGPGLFSFDVTQPPPPAPPPHASKPAVSAPPSRGATRAPAPRNPPRPLPTPTPASPAVDAGRGSASGAAAASGSGVEQGGQGSGSESGGAGSGAVTAPVHISGALTDADYRRSALPKGAAGTVVIAFRVRSDGGVDNCSTVRSSGYAAIDSETCRLVEQRFKFRPAHDLWNHPMDFTLRTDFTWRPR
ncbi:MAG TPA: TonB family protein [Croceibacterium sp.]|nr:TonB family protein [Croceibacterium sp.]